MTLEQVVERMGVSVTISQIESGDVSTQDALSRFVAALRFRANLGQPPFLIEGEVVVSLVVVQVRA
jgi:hypothetical protein